MKHTERYNCHFSAFGLEKSFITGLGDLRTSCRAAADPPVTHFAYRRCRGARRSSHFGSKKISPFPSASGTSSRFAGGAFFVAKNPLFLKVPFYPQEEP